jgi:hypothetical protein
MTTMSAGKGADVLRTLLLLVPRLLLAPTRFDADVDPFLTDDSATTD